MHPRKLEKVREDVRTAPSLAQRHSHSHDTEFDVRTGFVMNSQVMPAPIGFVLRIRELCRTPDERAIILIRRRARIDIHGWTAS